MWKSKSSYAISFGIVALLSGCGTYVPEIQEPPGNSEVGQRLVQSIVTNVTCEVQDALFDLYKVYPKTFLDGWGIQLTLSLTTDEKGSIIPVANLLPPSPANSIFNLGLGATLSAEATRINKLNSYLLVDELRRARCPAELRPGGLFLLQSDLKLREWLFDAVVANGTGVARLDKDKIGGPFKANVLSHEVKFEVLSSGNISPGWKLTTATAGAAFSASRDRTHDLTITIGPADTSFVTTMVNGERKRALIVHGPGEEAAALHNASIIGNAVGDAVRNAIRP
jgi:hypothetical protein